VTLNHSHQGQFANIVQTVHVRKDPLKWAVFTSPFFFLIAGTICTLSIVYKGSPNLGLDKRPAWFISSVTLGVGFGLFVLAGLFFVPYVHCKVIKKDYTVKLWDIWQGPALFMRGPPADASEARVPNYAVIQHGDGDEEDDGELTVPVQVRTKNPEAIEKAPSGSDNELSTEKTKHAGKSLDQLEDAVALGNPQAQYRLLLKRAQEKHHAHLRTKRGPLGWVSCFSKSYEPCLLTMRLRQCAYFTTTLWVLARSMSCII
jgi:sodium-dependent phosphate transporter